MRWVPFFQWGKGRLSSPVAGMHRAGMSVSMSEVTSCLLHTKKSPNWGVMRHVMTRMVPENIIFVPDSAE
jgi:hypothetical protein